MNNQKAVFCAMNVPSIMLVLYNQKQQIYCSCCLSFSISLKSSSKTRVSLINTNWLWANLLNFFFVLMHNSCHFPIGLITLSWWNSHQSHECNHVHISNVYEMDFLKKKISKRSASVYINNLAEFLQHV